jgi:hypothetical protein
MYFRRKEIGQVLINRDILINRIRDIRKRCTDEGSGG